MMRYLFILLLFACNPVKKVLNDKKMFEQVKEAVIKSGACINDTVVITKTVDSFIYINGVVTEIDSIPCKDFDTTIGRSHIRVSSGVLYFSTKDSVVYRTNTITNNIRDKKLEEYLKLDISRRDSLISLLKQDISYLNSDKYKLTAKIGATLFKLWAVIIIAMIIVFRKQILKLITNGAL
jgi:hypothetical protein